MAARRFGFEQFFEALYAVETASGRVSCKGRAQASACSPARYCRSSQLCARGIGSPPPPSFAARRHFLERKALDEVRPREKQAEILGEARAACDGLLEL
ncbi:hypothetical protein [Rhizobium nepotum]|uniref:hypothetical protein n=1 Tax=Rhizobium nepotum TaxID=1035271 RepID=UPI003CEA4E1D